MIANEIFRTIVGMVVVGGRAIVTVKDDPDAGWSGVNKGEGHVTRNADTMSVSRERTEMREGKGKRK